MNCFNYSLPHWTWLLSILEVSHLIDRCNRETIVAGAHLDVVRHIPTLAEKQINRFREEKKLERIYLTSQSHFK